MRKLLFLLLLLGICVSLYRLTQEKPIKRKAVLVQAIVSSVLPVDQSTFLKTSVRVFREKKLDRGNKFSRFSVARNGEENFPAEYQLSHYKDDQSIARYLSIAPEQRKDDFYLYDFSDADSRESYWTSEYYQDNRAVPFRCNFIVHHEPKSDASTEVEIFEFAPRLWVGKKFSFDRHGPGRRLDIRNVEPTTSDRVELLQLLQESVR